MLKNKISINYLILYLYVSFFTYQLGIVNLPVSAASLLFSFVFLIHIPNIDFFKYKRNISLFGVLLVLSSISIFYAPNKLEALQRVITYALLFYFIFIIEYKKMTSEYMLNFLQHAFWLGGFYIVLSYIYFDSLLDYKGEFEGFMHNRHNISFLLGIYFILSVVYLQIKRSTFLYIVGILILSLNIYLIYNSYARIGLFVLAIFFVCVFTALYFKSSSLVKTFTSVVVLSLIISCFQLVIDSKFVVDALDRGLTGRGAINEMLFSYLKEYPYGFILGFGSGSLEVIGNGLISSSIRDSNNIIAVIFELGIVGLMLFMAIFIKYFYSLYRLNQNTNVDYVSFIPLPIIFVVSETTWINFNTFETLIMFVFIAYTFKASALPKKLASERVHEN